MTKHSRHIMFAATMLGALAGCSEQVQEQGRTCPCDEGWTCCPDSTCMPEGEACGIQESPSVVNAEAPCSILDTSDDALVDPVRWFYLYDPSGLSVRDDADIGDNGTIDEVYSYGYDSAGRQTSVTDVLNGVTLYQFIKGYDSAGRISSFDSDFDDDGTIESSTAWTYAGMTVVQLDHRAAAPTADVRTTFFENALGQPDHAEVDRGDDGTIDEAIIYEYNAASQLTRRARDRGVDGSFENEDTYVYDAAGRAIQQTVRRGPFTLVADTLYDGEDRIASTTIFDGEFTATSTYAYCGDDDARARHRSSENAARPSQMKPKASSLSGASGSP